MRIYKLGMDQFDDALTVGQWFAELEGGIQDNEPAYVIAQLEALRAGDPVRQALDRLIAGCMKLAEPPGDVDPQLKPDDVACMPIMTVAESVAVLMEENTDFFLRSLPSLTKAAARMKSIGSELPSSLQPPATR